MGYIDKSGAWGGRIISNHLKRKYFQTLFFALLLFANINIGRRLSSNKQRNKSKHNCRGSFLFIMHILKVENVFVWAGSARKMSSMQCIRGVTINWNGSPMRLCGTFFFSCPLVPIKLTDSQEPVGTHSSLTDINSSHPAGKSTCLTLRGLTASETYLLVHTWSRCSYEQQCLKVQSEPLTLTNPEHLYVETSDWEWTLLQTTFYEPYYAWPFVFSVQSLIMSLCSVFVATGGAHHMGFMAPTNTRESQEMMHEIWCFTLFKRSQWHQRGSSLSLSSHCATAVVC